MKKPFKERKIGKILTNPIVKSAVSLIPFGIGSVASNFLDDNATPAGAADPKTMPIKAMKIAIYCVLAYLWLKGHITPEDAEAVKDFITE